MNPRIDFEYQRAVVQPVAINTHPPPSSAYFAPILRSWNLPSAGNVAEKCRWRRQPLDTAVTSNHVTALETRLPDGEIVRGRQKHGDAPG